MKYPYYLYEKQSNINIRENVQKSFKLDFEGNGQIIKGFDNFYLIKSPNISIICSLTETLVYIHKSVKGLLALCNVSNIFCEWALNLITYYTINGESNTVIGKYEMYLFSIGWTFLF